MELLPSNTDAEKLVLGSILLNGASFDNVSAMVSAEHFHLEKHRRIFYRMKDIHARGEAIDRVTVANELMKAGQLESVDGLSYLASLDEGMPQIENIDSYIRIILEKYALRRIIILSQRTMGKCLSEEGSAAQIAEESISDLRAVDAASKGMDEVPQMDRVMDSLPGGPLGILDPKQARGCIMTGFEKLDVLTAGFEPGTLVVIAGRPGMGKSAMMADLSLHMAKEGNPVTIFSLEMSKRELVDRMLASAARVNLLRLRSHTLGAEEKAEVRRVMPKIYGLPIFVDDRATQSVGDISGKMERMKRNSGVKVVFVDHLQMMTSSAMHGKSRSYDPVQALQDICEGLKAIGKRLDICFVALSQLRRPDNGDNRPNINQLRGSGGIEMTADLVLLLYRESVYRRERADLRGKAELIIGKARNGPTGVVHLRFHDEYARFEDED